MEHAACWADDPHARCYWCVEAGDAVAASGPAGRGSNVRRMQAASVSLVVLCAFLFAASAAYAADGGRLSCEMAASAARSGAAFPARTAQVRALTGNGVINGMVRDFAGDPVPGAQVGWATQDFMSGALAKADANGLYQLTNVPALAGSGQLFLLSPADGQPSYHRAKATFLDPGPTTFDWWPGRLAVTVNRGGPWRPWRSIWLALYGSDAQAAQEGDAPINLATTASTYTGFGYAMPGAYTSAVLTFHGGGQPSRCTEALEIELPAASPALVASGETGSDTFTFDEATAARLWIGGWASGSPGSIATLHLAGFPAGMVLRVTGEALNGGAPNRDYGTVTIPTPSPADFTVRLRVPTKHILLGDYYTFDLQPVGGQAQYTTSYETCRLTSSAASIRRGAPVRLSGRVPITFDPSLPTPFPPRRQAHHYLRPYEAWLTADQLRSQGLDQGDDCRDDLDHERDYAYRVLPHAGPASEAHDLVHGALSGDLRRQLGRLLLARVHPDLPGQRALTTPSRAARRAFQSLPLPGHGL
jgi:hypothetical protein